MPSKTSRSTPTTCTPQEAALWNAAKSEASAETGGRRGALARWRRRPRRMKLVAAPLEMLLGVRSSAREESCSAPPDGAACPTSFLTAAATNC